MAKKEFIWTDELVAEFTTWSLTQAPTMQGRYSDIEQFKKSKEVDDRVEVTKVYSIFSENKEKNRQWVYGFNSSVQIPEEQFPLIKEVVEKVLNQRELTDEEINDDKFVEQLMKDNPINEVNSKEDGNLNKERFKGQLRELINSFSLENKSNTPDYILANYLNECLDALNTAINFRDKHNQNSEETFTIQELEEAEEKAFEAAKKGRYILGSFVFEINSFNDYKNTIL